MADKKTIVQDAIVGVWNEHDDETHRRDQSHYRGVGRWANDEMWKDIGRSSVTKLRMLWRMLNRPPATMKNLVALEWGPGGGANAFGLHDCVDRYFGVDISSKNLAECARVTESEGWAGYFHPVLLEGPPREAVGRIEPVDVFLSTAVFQHFPSRSYGVEALEAIRSVCKPGAAGFIQIRFDNGNERYSGISSIEEYKAKHIRATSYRIDEFWDHCQAAGFSPISVGSIRTANNYATFYLSVR